MYNQSNPANKIYYLFLPYSKCVPQIWGIKQCQSASKEEALLYFQKILNNIYGKNMYLKEDIIPYTKAADQLTEADTSWIKNLGILPDTQIPK